MRVLIGSAYFEAHRGGVEIVAGALGRALCDIGLGTMTWMASDADDPPANFPGPCVSLPASNVTEQRLGFPLPLPGRAALRVIRDAVEHADAVLLHDALYPTNVYAAHVARRQRKPVLLIQHVGLVPYRNPVLRVMMATANRLIAVPMLNKADQVVYISGLTQDYFAPRCRYRASPDLILNGVRQDLPEGGRETRTAIRDSLGLPADKPLVLFVGRFVEKKGLAVIRALVDRHPQITFLLCGRGDMRPEDWQLPNVIVRRDLDAAPLARTYQAADVLILPSVGEGLPLVVQEALSLGCPVIGTPDLTRADPWLGDRITCVPVSPANPEATAEAWGSALRAALASPTRPDLTEARMRYSWRAAAERYGAHLRNIVERRKGQDPQAR